MLHTVQFHFGDILRKTGLPWWRPDQWLPGAGGGVCVTVKEQHGGGPGGAMGLCILAVLVMTGISTCVRTDGTVHQKQVRLTIGSFENKVIPEVGEASEL